MKSCNCTKCGEPLTAPYFFEGQPYGWTCIKTVNPTAKKKNSKEFWIEADEHNFNSEVLTKQVVIVYYTFNGKRIKGGDLVLFDTTTNTHNILSPYYMLGAGGKIFVNIYEHIKKQQLADNIKKGLAAC